MNEDLHQQLWEYVYGLLTEDEALEVRELITSDPQAARAYAKIKLQTELLGRAARLDQPLTSWHTSTHEGDAANATPRVAPVESKVSRSAFSHAANWLVGLAAMGLLCLVGSSWWLQNLSSRPPALELAKADSASVELVRTVLTGPSRLNADADSPFTVRTTDINGAPITTSVRYRVYDASGEVAWEDTEATNRQGTVRFEVPVTLNKLAARLEVATDDGGLPISRPLEVSENKFATYLRMDRPLYRPGDRVRFRTVTLSRFSLQPEEDLDVEFSIADAQNQVLAASPQTTASERGVASGEFDLAEDLPDGKYTLFATNSRQAFPRQWRDFDVREFETPRLKKKLELVRDSYSSGDEVIADVSVEKAEGGPLQNAPLELKATLDNQTLAVQNAATDADGNYRFQFQLPETIELGQASIDMTVSDEAGRAESLRELVPINTGRVNVIFFPQGGDLVADLPNQVYFYGRDPSGSSVHLDGRIVDDQNSEVCQATTQHEGRGVFRVVPSARRHYRLVLNQPTESPQEIPLPSVSPRRFATLDAYPGVFEGTAPVRWTIHSRDPAVPLVLAAYCRGAMVGHADIETREYREQSPNVWSAEGALPLSEEAEGVIRLTLFDRTDVPPEPIAERLVYRRFQRKLQVAVDSDSDTYAPGEQVGLRFRVHDEIGAPSAAVLGVSVVDDAVLSLAQDKSVRMPTYFHLLTEIENPEDLEDANFYLSREPGAAEALDLLLGTQGWRRFVELPVDTLALGKAGSGGFGGGDDVFSYDSEAAVGEQLVAFTDDVLPLVEDNRQEVERRRAVVAPAPPRAKSTKHSERSWAFTLGVVAMLGGLLLLALQAAASQKKLRSFALVTGAAAMVWGLVSIASSTWTPGSAVPTSVALDAGPASSERALKELAEHAPQMQVEAKGVLGERGRGELAIAPNAYAVAPEAPRPVAQAEESTNLADAAAAQSPTPLNREADTVERQMSEPPSEAGLVSKDSPDAVRLKSRLAGTEARADLVELSTNARGLNDERFSQQLREPNYSTWYFRRYAAVEPLERLDVTPSQPTALWRPFLLTSDEGEARVELVFPNAPTTYRAIVEAHGQDRLGTGEKLITVKPSSD